MQSITFTQLRQKTAGPRAKMQIVFQIAFSFETTLYVHSGCLTKTSVKQIPLEARFTSF